MALIDLSHTLRDGLVTDPRLAPVEVEEVWSRGASAARYAEGVSFQIAATRIVQNSGTYIDCPFHRHEDGRGTWDYPLERVADLPGVVIDAREEPGAPAAAGTALGPEVFEGVEVSGRAVLVCTGWDGKWGSRAYGAGDHPFLTEDGARALVERGAALYGIDTLNADDFDDPRRPVHTVLLGAEVAIVENLTGLDRLVGRAFRFFAAPVKVEGLGSFPVQAMAVTEG